MAEHAAVDGNAAHGADPITTVRSFLKALERLDIDEALTYAHPDISYQNVPLPPAKGYQAFEKQMRSMAKFGSGFEAKVHNVAADGSTVLTERTDVLEIGGEPAAFWVCGTFEVRDGKIVLWRDYFDWINVTLALAKIVPGVIAGAVRKRLNR